MPYVFDTLTSSDNPSAASQAAKTSKIMGIMLARVKCEFRIVREAITKRDSIIPSKHKREDIRWDRYINSPAKATMNAVIIFIYTRDTW